MLDYFFIKNFKSLSSDSGKIEIKPLNIFVGPNSSGKSSYLQALLMLKQTILSRELLSPLIPNSNLIKLGGYSDLIFKNDIKLPLQIEIGLISKRHGRENIYERPVLTAEKKIERQIQSIKEFFPFFNYEDNHFVYKIDLRTLSSSEIIVDNLNIIYDEKKLVSIEYNKEGRGSYFLKSEYMPVNNEARTYFRPGKFYRIPLSLFSSFNLYRFFHDLELTLEDVFNKLYYIGPLRNYPQRFYILSGESPQDVGMQGENTIELLISSEMKKGQNLKSRTDYWMNNFGLAKKLIIERIKGSHYYVKVIDPTRETETNISDVGFGISQILPVIVETLFSPPDSLILIEQPEIHLHPKIQADLADLFISESKKKKFIIETHSEHLVTRIQRRVAEGVINASDVKVYYFNMGKNGTILKELIMDDNGYFNEWPKGLFGDELEDHYQMLFTKLNKKETF